MKVVIQRVLNAKLKVDNKEISEIGKGYVVFLGVKKGDTTKEADFIAKKMSAFRFFEDECGKTNKSILDVNGEILLVSQFTLCANVTHGNRPDFFDAEVPEKANELYLYVAKSIEKNGVSVKLGVFGADMKIEQINDGPFTVVLEKSFT